MSRRSQTTDSSATPGSKCRDSEHLQKVSRGRLQHNSSLPQSSHPHYLGRQFVHSRTAFRGPASLPGNKEGNCEGNAPLSPCQAVPPTVDEVRKYRETWALAPISAGKKLERLRTFFRFCVDNQWMQANPAKGITAPIGQPRLVCSEDRPLGSRSSSQTLDSSSQVRSRSKRYGLRTSSARAAPRP